MNTTSPVYFKQIRHTTYTQWSLSTGRSLNCIGTMPGELWVDDFGSGYFECKWQYNARTIVGDSDWHVSYFCSLGEWVGNITDMLLDTRLDRVPVGLIGYDDFNQALFRYYTRFMLVVSEIITDFESLLLEFLAPNLETKKANKKIQPRARLSTTTINIPHVLEYINSICKHKVSQAGHTSTKLHQVNHHLPIYFEDSGQTLTFTNPVCIGNPQVIEPDGIIVPKLGFLISTILNGYQVLDNEFDSQSNQQQFHDFIQRGKSLP